jgi:phosphatidylserine/phosphatidylglycerophosphate/cardiolipin synthase-like enzyme
VTRNGVVERLDALVGAGLEQAVRRHHRRRLTRRGWLHALAPPREERLWAAGDPPPRQGNTLDVLIDGAAALEAIGETIARARSHVHVAGWHVAPDFALQRRGRRHTVREVLAEAAQRVPVRVLVWAGTPLPLFHPTRGEVRDASNRLCAGTAIRCARDARERPMHCHHEKLVIVDDEVAFVGGIDLTGLAGDRWDDPRHPDRGTLGWHDVAARLQGPAVADVAAHFALRWAEVAGERLYPAAPAAPAGDRTVQVVRTVPEHVYRRAWAGDFRILESYTRALRSARRLVYLENQFLWSSEIVCILVDKLRRPPTDEFRLLVVLPAKPNNGADDTRGQLGVLADADGAGGRFLACTVYAGPTPAPTPVYVHAKVGIVDDRWLTLGSANLNEHSLFNDSEMNVVCCDSDLARATRLRLWAEHLDTTIDEVDADTADVFDRLWKPIATDQLERRRAGAPPTHRLCRLPGISRRTDRLRGPLNGLLVDG